MPLNRFTASPHQFDLGATVFLRGHTAPFMVLAHGFHRGWPHYELSDIHGSHWLASQLELSSKPIQRGGYGG